jgi:hypothetical protein
MKKKILGLLLAVITFSLAAQTYVSGELQNDSTWDLSGSPYIVVSDVTVPVSIRLTINAGVEILFQEDNSLIIYGIIEASGTAQNMIVFDSFNESEKWNGIQIIDTSSSLFEYCTISNSKNSGIRIDNSSNISIRYSSIGHNSSSEGAGINVNVSADILIELSAINDNHGNVVDDHPHGGNGIACFNSDKINIRYNSIFNNEADAAGGGILLSECVDSFIEENLISNNVAWQGGGIAVLVGSGNMIINNLIHNNSTIQWASGGGIYLKTACNIIGNEIYSNSAPGGCGGGLYADGWSTNRIFDYNKIYSNTAYTGGGIYLFGIGSYPQINYCNIYENIALGGKGGGIYVVGNSPQIFRSTIRNNKALRGGGIYLRDTVPPQGHPVCRVEHSLIYKNDATDKGGGVFVENHEANYYSNVDIYNSIIYQNTATINTGKEIYIEAYQGNYYSSYLRNNCIGVGGIYTENPNVVIIENNIFADPRFNNPNFLDFYLLPDSPCIDAGHPNSPLDPDGSRADIGIIPFDHDFDKKFFHPDYNWVSFPRLPMSSSTNTNQAVTADNLVYDITPNPDFMEILHKIQNSSYDLIYNGEYWNYPTNIYSFHSSRGYKIKTLNPQVTEITIDGPRLESNVAIDLIAGDNWVGYWLPESRNLNEAFGEHFDKVVSVKAENWEWKDMRMQRGIHDPVPVYYPIRPLQYGKGYVVRLREAIPNFRWNTGLPTVVKEIPKAERFDFTVLADYETIVIGSANGREDVLEIGAFIDDVCVGAAVVTEYPVQLLVYAQNRLRSSEVIFKIAMNERGIMGKVKHQTLNLNTGKFENIACILGRFEHNIVKLDVSNPWNDEEQPISAKITLLGNYPNPFNPETTISFFLPDSDDVKLSIYNIKGQKVKTLMNQSCEKGNYSVIWDGKDKQGNPVGSGLYLYRLQTRNREMSKKMLLLK